MAAILTDDAELAGHLRATRVIAVLGAHRDPARAAFYVPEYLHRQGYRMCPVNPVLVGEELWGEPVVATLAELRTPVDLVDVFRRPEALEGHLADILAMAPPPNVVWLQLGIRNHRFAQALVARGIDVVEDRCLKVEDRRLRQAGLLG